MQDIQAAKFEAWRKHSERFNNCKHDKTELRVRTIRGGAQQYVHQCMACGGAARQPLSKAKAMEATGGTQPAAFDESLIEAWRVMREQSGQEINARFSGESFFEVYDEYLKTPAWEQRRQLVLRRAAGTCEGCGLAPPTQVHHLTYEHVGAEFLFELAALCGSCHERIHEDNARSLDGPEHPVAGLS